MAHHVLSLPSLLITVPYVFGAPHWRAGPFGLLACRGLCGSRGAPGTAFGQHQVGDSLAIVQTVVTVQRLDTQLPLQPHNVSSIGHTVLVDWDPGAFGAPHLHETSHQYDVLDIPAAKTQGRASTWIAQLLLIVTIVALAFSKLCSFWFVGKEQVNMRWMAELLGSHALFLISGPAVIILNKHIMSEHDFKFPIVLASLGNVLLMLLTRLSVILGICKLQNTTMGWGRYARVVLLMNVFNFGTQAIGMWSYMFVSVPEVQILKSMTVVLVMIGTTVLLKEPFGILLLLSVLIIAAGVCVSAVFEVSGTSHHLANRPGARVFGISLCMIASIFEASKIICSQILMDSVSVFDGVYLSAPPFLLLALIFVAAIELRGLVHYHFTLALVGLLVLNAILTGLSVLSSFWLVELVGAMTLKVVTQARNLVVVFVAIWLFDEDCSLMEYVGYMMTLIGMGVYDRAKSQLGDRKQNQAAVQEAQGEAEVQNEIQTDIVEA